MSCSALGHACNRAALSMARTAALIVHSDSSRHRADPRAAPKRAASHAGADLLLPCIYYAVCRALFCSVLRCGEADVAPARTLQRSFAAHAQAQHCVGCARKPTKHWCLCSRRHSSSPKGELPERGRDSTAPAMASRRERTRHLKAVAASQVRPVLAWCQLGPTPFPPPPPPPSWVSPSPGHSFPTPSCSPDHSPPPPPPALFPNERAPACRRARGSAAFRTCRPSCWPPHPQACELLGRRSSVPRLP